MITFGKRAQIATTTTWIVATIIIVVIIGVSLFVTFNFFDSKTTSFRPVKDTLVSKSFFSYLLTDVDSEGVKSRVYDEIKKDENLSEQSGNLGIDIFEGIYGIEYNRGSWLGILIKQNPLVLRAEENNFFGKRQDTIVETNKITQRRIFVSEKVILNELKDLEVILLKPL